MDKDGRREIKRLRFADDEVLVVESKQKLKDMATEFAEMSER